MRTPPYPGRLGELQLRLAELETVADEIEAELRRVGAEIDAELDRLEAEGPRSFEAQSRLSALATKH
jgi:hypothetical protein